MNATQESIPLVSLFAGAGGLDLGFRQHGFRAVLALDSDAAAVETYNANKLEYCAVLCDLANLNGHELLALVKKQAPHIRPRGVIGGPPCQAFSIGNVKRKRRDRRGALGLRYAALLGVLNHEFQLDFFLFENVTGLTNPTHHRKYKNICNALRAAGFELFTGQLDAVSFGVPQRRKRLFLVGVNARKFPWLKYRLPLPTTKKDLTVRNAIGKLPEPFLFKRGTTADQVPFHPNHWTMNPRSPKFTSKKGAKGSDGRSFRRLDWDKPSRTVAYGNREIHLHPKGHRRLSVLEAMLLQGFRADFELRGNFSNQIAQVSNAVPPPLAAALAHSIKVQLYERVELLQRKLLIWFKTHQRRFPWRRTRDPFKILVAEKLLQQTAATRTVVDAFNKLVGKYPTANALSNANVSHIEKIIRPLGFHYRAGELVRLSASIVRRHDGKVPSNLRDLLDLPGVGDYSARAVLAFAYQQAVPVVDTNVARFLSRYFGFPNSGLSNPARDRKLIGMADALIPSEHGREFNLAILDICAAHCRYARPLCRSCPLKSDCSYAVNGLKQTPSPTSLTDRA